MKGRAMRILNLLGGFLYLLGVGLLIPLSPAEAQSLRKVTMIGFEHPSLGAFLTPLIKMKEFDKKNGLDITFELKDGRTVRADYASGRYQVDGSGAYLNHAQFRVKGLKTQFLFNTFDYYGAFLTEKPAIKKIADLNGREIAAAKFSTNYWLFMFFAKHGGLDLAKAKVQSSGVAGLGTLLMAGRVDAVHMWEPALTVVEHRAPGRFRRIEYDQEWASLTGRKVNPYIAVAAHERWIRENAPLIPRLFATHKDAERFVARQPDEAARIIARGAKLPEPVIREVIKSGRIRLNVAWSHEVSGDIQAMFKAAHEVGSIEKIPDPGIFYRP